MQQYLAWVDPCHSMYKNLKPEHACLDEVSEICSPALQLLSVLQHIQGEVMTSKYLTIVQLARRG